MPSNSEINTDAFQEFANADYADVKAVAATLPKTKLFDWLKDPATPASRFGLYGLLAGNCGKKDDAAVIRQLLDDPTRRFASGLDGLLAGYILLDPKSGWEYLTSLVKNQEKQDFATQHAIVKVLRFLWDYGHDAVAKEQVVEGMKMSMANGEFADFAIEDLRKWGRWELTESHPENRRPRHAQERADGETGRVEVHARRVGEEPEGRRIHRRRPEG